ncbi:hypothetical protein ACN42_g2380 [Penicillium freii]|uniref:Uncharacterized protein n=1 Tax=Penicillium freii TaxID=48697 RepID=A0A124GSK3_PENFR|nr:hypothetical protein ACN42_g2380 [Penicillium freii]
MCTKIVTRTDNGNGTGSRYRLTSESNTFLFLVYNKGILYRFGSNQSLELTQVRFITVVSSRSAPPPIANTSEPELPFLQLFAPRFF